jgi:hypothetical protein
MFQNESVQGRMRPSSCKLILVAVACLSSVACNGPPAPKANAPNQHEAVLIVTNRDGSAVVLHPGDTTKIIAVASWCPHTRSFVRAINDSQVRSELAAYKLVFVLEADESLRFPPDPGAGARPILNPEFLATLPGDYYFLAKGRSVDAGFPSVYSTETGTFDGHAKDWVRTKSTRAADLYNKFEAQ